MSIKLGLDNVCYQHTVARGELTLEQFLDKTVAYGGQAVQMDPIWPAFGLDLQASRLKCLRLLLEERGLEIVVKGNSAGAGFLAVEGAAAHQVVQAMRSKFAATAALGGRVVRLVSRAYPFPAGEWTPPPAPRRVVLEWLVQVLESLVSAAKEYGVVLALENHGDLYISELEWVLKTINVPELRAQLDVAEQIALFEDPLEAVRRLAPYAVTIHWTDIVPIPTEEGYLMTSCGPKEGLLPLREMAAVLRGVPQDLLVFVAGQAKRDSDEDAIARAHMAFLRKELYHTHAPIGSTEATVQKD